MKLKEKVKESGNIKEIIKKQFKISKRLQIKLKKESKIYLNGNTCNINTRTNVGDIIEIEIDFDEQSENIVPTNIALDIIYEDDGYLVVNKQAGIATHPSQNNYENTLSNGVKYYFKKNNVKKKIRPVNRLDKNTSGLIIFAKNEYIQEQLIEQMRRNMFKKEYIAIVDGIVETNKGTINKPIKRKEQSIIERTVAEDGEQAITQYEVLERTNKNTKLRFILQTGRTHQIRVHCKSIGHPITGDTLYGKASNNIQRQALHSYKMSFINPITKQKVQYIAPIPKDIEELVKE